LDNRVPLDEYSVKERGSDTLAFSSSTFLADAPCTFADVALPATFAEMIYAPSATRRFRVLCGHTRELWQKPADLI